jgi:hypothetical protein
LIEPLNLAVKSRLRNITQNGRDLLWCEAASPGKRQDDAQPNGMDTFIEYMRTVLFMSSLPLTMQLSTSVVLILLPLVVIELGLVVFSLVDLFKPERRVIGDNKLVWALIIVLVGTIGPIVYLLAGRKQN